MVRRIDRNGEALIWCRKVFGLCAAASGTNIDESMQARENEHRRVRERCQTET